MNKLNIFVSSTCYDLSQVRADMSEFIENSGHNPILSESTNFPINPSKSTLDNCISAVNDHADVFVLIVGNRYGSPVPSGKSITNTEYLAAKTKGIPIYIFIKSDMISILPIWKSNKDGDFSNYVDSTEIFNFIADLRDDSKVWTFEFKHAQDIVLTLKNQLSYLFKDALLVRNRLKTEANEISKLNISNEALKIVLDKPELYEARFFIQNSIDKLLEREKLKNDYEYKLKFSYKYSVRNNKEVLGWLQDRTNSLSELMDSLSTIVNIAMPYYYGEPGIPADLKGLFYVAEAYGRIYENLLNWYTETTTTKLNDECKNITQVLANLATPIIEDVWNFPFDNMKAIDEALEITDEEQKIKSLTLSLDLQLDPLNLLKFEDEMAELRQTLINEINGKLYE